MERRITILIILLVIRKIISATDSGHPFGVASVPINGLAQAFVERYGWLPAQFALHFAAFECVAAIVAGAIFDMGK